MTDSIPLLTVKGRFATANGMTVLTIAKAAGNTNIVQLLENVGAKE